MRLASTRLSLLPGNNFMKKCFCSIVLVFLGLCCSCAILPQTGYQRPAVTIPDRWQQQIEPSTVSAEKWWESFGDAQLNELMKEALSRNTDLAAAALTLKKARLQLAQAKGDRLPGIAVQSDATSNRMLGSSSSESHSFSAQATVSYELDLWGRLSSAADAARWSAQASEADKQATALSLNGTVSSLYWKIAYLNQRVRIAEESIDYARRTLEIVRVQKNAGAVARLEELEAERSLASQEANREELIQQLTEARNALSILFDGPPSSLQRSEPQDVAVAALPAVAVELPAQLVSRRPDMRAAEARLRASLATTNATRASFYPTFSLTGGLGGSSETLSRVLSNPLASLGAGLVLPFIEWHNMQRSVAISEVDYEQAILTFRKTLYSALADVENCLSARRQLLVQQQKLELSSTAAKKVEDLYRIRYQAGGSSLKTWLDAQEIRRQAEIALLENRLARIDNQISLCKALGGGVDGSFANPD